MNKKIVYLLLALVLPVLVFVFLRNFGKNQFDIPIYYQEGVTYISSDCSVTSQGQYLLSDTSLQAIGWRHHNLLLVTDASEVERRELARACEGSDSSEVQIIDMNVVVADRLAEWKRCSLFIRDPFKVVLIDDQKRIRGYYALNSREEIDRLEVELKILLKKY